MTTQRMSCVAFLLAATMFCTLADAAQPKVEYYKAGDVGAFTASIVLPAGTDVARALLSVRPSDDKVYLLYLKRPASVLKRARSPRQAIDDFTPEQRAELEKINKQMQDLDRKRWPAGPGGFRVRPAELGKIRMQIRGLDAVLTNEQAKQENQRDKTLVAKVTAQIKELEAKAKELEKALAAKRKQYDVEYAKLQARYRAAYEAAREQALEARAAKQVPVQIFGRFQGSGKASVTVLACSTDKLLAPSLQVARIELDLPKDDGGTRDVLTGWATAQAHRFTQYVMESPYTSYYQYCLLAAHGKYGVREDKMRMAFAGLSNRGRRPDLYAATTGALAIQESLQLDAMRGGRDATGPRDVPLASLTGPTIKSHPFKKMMEGRKPTIFPAAALVPHDAYYCHFSSISKEIAATDILKQWGASLLRAATVDARDADVPAKFQTQLCIGVSMLTRMFGDLVIGDIVLTGSDPFVREGTDLTVLMQVKNRDLFAKQMKGYRDDALKAYPKATVANSKYQGVVVLSVTTPDRVVSSHSAYLGNYSVYSNSMVALRRIIDTHAKRKQSMADNLDFQYMRTVFPGTTKDEDGFLYLSDAFIRKMVGPRWKIGEQRRVVCQNHLRMISNAATMYRTDMRKAPTLKALVEGKYLPKGTLACPARPLEDDEAIVYSLDKSGRAVCSVHNVLRHCTPVDSIAFDKVTRKEAGDYKRFVSNYNRYWSRYFDPIGIRFKVGDHIEAETCILPLIENTIYNELREVIGGKPRPLKARVLTPRTVLAVTLNVNQDGEDYKEALAELQRVLPPTIPPIAKCIGSSISIGVCDGDVLFTVDPAGMGMMGRMDMMESLAVSTVLSAFSLPVYAVLELKDEKMAETVIRDLLKLAEAESKMARGWDRMFGVENYTIKSKQAGGNVNTLLLRLGPVRLRLYYAIAKKRLVVATKPDVLKDVLAALAKQKADVVGNIRIDVQPKAFKKLLPSSRTGWQERMRSACHRNLPGIRALIECHGATAATLGGASRRVEGVTLRCPSGGAYKHDAMRDTVFCTVHANAAHPCQPDEFTGREDLIRFLLRLRSLSSTFRFTKEGIMTKVELDLDPVAPATKK
jgi:hypothetical protein